MCTPRAPTLTRPGGALLRTLEVHTAGVNAVAVLDQKRVVSASDDWTLRVWDVEGGETLRTLEGHTSLVNAVAMLDEKRVVSASSDQTLRIWDVTSGKTLRTLKGHTDWVRAVAVLDEKRVVSAADDQTLRVWDVASGQTLAVFNLEAAASAVAVTPAGRTLVAGDEKGGFHFLDLDLDKV